MPFPASQRVFYAKNPLEEVVCQLRFPPILRIDTESPAAFQELVRPHFPLYQRVTTATQLAFQLPAELMQAFAGGGGVAHEFVSADQVWRLSLTRDFVALTTKSYRQWSEFKDRFRVPLEAILTTYTPAFFTRVGLRYRDRIDRDALQISGVEWRQLLRSEAVGELADQAIAPQIEHILRELVVKLTAEAGHVRILHGQQRENEKLTYIIDCDFFTEKQIDTKAVEDVLDAFNRRAGHLFRWYISGRLHDAMEPRDKPPA